MKYIVTGGAGFIGSHIVEKLLDENNEVICIDNFSTGKIENISHHTANPKCTIVDCDILSLDECSHYFSGVDGIFHEAAIPSVSRSVKNPLPSTKVNILGSVQVLFLAVKHDIKKVVLASSSSVYGDTKILPKTENMKLGPKSPYAVSKYAVEEYARVFQDIYGLKTVALRYFNVFGPRQDPKSEYAAVIPRFITGVLQSNPLIIYGDGTQTRDFTYVADVVSANIQAMQSDATGVFNVACNRQTSLLTLANEIMTLCENKVPITFDPPREGDIHDSLADITAANENFRYKPKYSLQEGLKETINYYQKIMG